MHTDQAQPPPQKKNNRRVIQHRQQCGMLAEGYKECVCCVYIYIYVCVCVCLGVLPRCNRVMQGRQITQENPLEFVKNKRAVFKKGSFGERTLVAVFGVSHSIFVPSFQFLRFVVPLFCTLVPVLCTVVPFFVPSLRFFRGLGATAKTKGRRKQESQKPSPPPPPKNQKANILGGHRLDE